MTGRSEIARDKVRTAALAVLHDVGVPGFTVDAVAKRSGVAKTTIYRHWDSANALLVDTLRCLTEPVPTPNTGSFRDDLRSLILTLDGAVRQEGRPRVMFDLLAAASDDPELQRLVDDMLRERHGPILTLLELARARGEIPADLDLDLALHLVEGPFFHRFVLRGVPLDEGELDVLLDHVVAGLRAPASVT